MKQKTNKDYTLAQSVINGRKQITKAQRQALIVRLRDLSGYPCDYDSRICFGIEFYDSEEKAKAADLITRLQGNTYNGGWFHGMPCGRDISFDYVVTQGHLDNAKPHDSLITQKVKVGTKLYAVTN